jgi:hypothetical protein
MAISASAVSDICRWTATAANMRFSSGVGRAVIVGAVDFEAPTFIARNSELQQNADTSLSCHHSNNDPSTLVDPKSLLYPIRKYGPKTLHELPRVGGLSSAVFSAELTPGLARRDWMHQPAKTRHWITRNHRLEAAILDVR